MKRILALGLFVESMCLFTFFFPMKPSIVHKGNSPKYGRMWMVVLSEPEKDGTLKLGSVCDEGTFLLDSALPEGIKLHSVVVVTLDGQDKHGLPIVSIKGAK